jgi:hypothetical protein
VITRSPFLSFVCRRFTKSPRIGPAFTNDAQITQQVITADKSFPELLIEV